MTMVETPIVVAMIWVLAEEVDPVMALHSTGVILTCISCSLIMASLFKQGKRLNFWVYWLYTLFSRLLFFYIFFPNMCPFC